MNLPSDPGSSEGLVKALNDIFAAESPRLVLNNAVQAPFGVRARGTSEYRYTTRSFLRDVGLWPVEAYIGRRGDVILRFTPEVSDIGLREESVVELPLSKALVNVYGLGFYVDEATALVEERAMSLIAVEADDRENAAHTNATSKASENPLFGSW